MFCGTCGTRVQPGASYCINCGSKIAAANSQPANGVIAVPDNAPNAVPQTTSATAQPLPPINAYPPGYGPPPGSGPPPGYAPSAGYAVMPAPGATGLIENRVLAPWWKRFVAMIIDCCVLGAGYFIVLIVIGIIVQHAQNGTTTTTTQTDSAQVALGLFVIFILASIPNSLYFGLMNGSKRGQTLGKMALGIAVRDATSGDRIRFWRSLGRSLMVVVFEIVLFVPFILDGLSPLWDKKRQAWHDKVVGTVVVDLRP
jgi:uncharacterized RDD family membrane protein YckC